MADDVAFFCPVQGMMGAGDASRVSQQAYRRATNVVLRDELPTSRPGVRVMAFESDSIAADFFRVNNMQGAKFFNPAKGQGGLVLGKDLSMIVVANGGRKFTLHLDGDGGSTRARLEEITGGYLTSSLVHLAWWCVAENYAIATDGLSNTFIYDANTETASVSTGYNSTEKPSSKFPNGATVTVYAHGRLLPVVNARQILASDSLHKSDQSSAKNLLDFTEQVYWNTGQYFMPPSAMGNITAGEILPLKNTQHGHGDVIWHCWDGVFSLNVNVAPRSSWSNAPEMVKHALLDAGATGPYAVTLWDGDQMYRTRHGITTLRSAAANASVEGNPEWTMSEPVQTFFQSDVVEWLRFCSVATWTTAKRFLCTIDPCVDGRFRWHRGLVVRNFAPVPAGRGGACWEGLWTLPPEAAGVIQMVRGLYPRERLVAFVRGNDGENRLVEFTDDLLDDVLEDGTRERIRCQIISRAMDFSQPFRDKEFLTGTLFLKNVRGKLDWGVWVRIDGNREWVFWRAGTIDAGETADDSGLVQAQPYSEAIALGNIPSECTTNFKTSRTLQFLIRWKGHAQIETLRLLADAERTKEEALDLSKFSIVSSREMPGDYDDFEYSNENDWTTTLKKQ